MKDFIESFQLFYTMILGFMSSIANWFISTPLGIVILCVAILGIFIGFILILTNR